MHVKRHLKSHVTCFKHKASILITEGKVSLILIIIMIIIIVSCYIIKELWSSSVKKIALWQVYKKFDVNAIQKRENRFKKKK